MFKIEITGETIADISQQIVSLAATFNTMTDMSVDDEGNAVQPKKRTRKLKDDSAPADGAASEPSSPNASQLEPADEGNGGASEGTEKASDGSANAGTGAAQENVSAGTTATNTASPSRDDVLTAATKFSQAHGPAALMAALKEVGAAKFSDIPAEKYQAFLDAMAKHDNAASALS